MQRDFTDRRDRLHESFTATLNLLDAEHREPDRWEEECLSYALGAMACGMYLVAEVELAAFKQQTPTKPHKNPQPKQKPQTKTKTQPNRK